MSADEIHVGDKSTVFRATFKDSDTVVDISTATTNNFLLKDPAGNITTKTGVFLTDGTDGVLQWVVPDTSILNVSGVWQIQGHIVLASGGSWKSDIKKFTVYSNIQ